MTKTGLMYSETFANYDAGKGGLDVIREAIGGDLNALDSIMSGKIQNAFCLQRPPAAHAKRDRGFWILCCQSFQYTC